MSGEVPATIGTRGSRRRLLLELCVLVFVAIVFILAGLFSNFYTSSTVEVVLFLQGSLMGGYGLVVPSYKTYRGKQDEDESNLIYNSFLLGLIYTAGAVLLLVNAVFTVPLGQYSFAVYTARLGYAVSIIAFLVFSGYYIMLRHKRTTRPQIKSREKLRVAPEIVVKITPPFVCEPRTLAYLLREEVPSLQVYRCQCLRVKATTTTVKSLMAKTRIDDRGPYFLNWAPKASEPTSDNPKRVDLVREEEAQLPIWYAAKQLFGPETGYPIQLTVVSDDVFKSVELDRLEKPTIDIVIQFIAENYTDPKPRQFKLTAKLNAKSWDELSLT